MSAESKPNSFGDGDQIKFQVVGLAPVEATWAWPVPPPPYFVVVVTEKNGEPLKEPCTLELGLYTTQLPQGIKHTSGIKFEGWDSSKFWTATTEGGMARARSAHRGTWVPNPIQGFIVPSTVVVTAEPGIYAPIEVAPPSSTQQTMAQRPGWRAGFERLKQRFLRQVPARTAS
jgi:hypothetical protein